MVNANEYIKDLHDTEENSHDVTIQWYTPPTALVGFGTSAYTVQVASRAVRHAKAHIITRYDAHVIHDNSFHQQSNCVQA